jgi:hypothetical protein
MISRNMARAAIAATVMAAVLGATPGHSHETLTTTVLFDREIVRILDRHCVMCHVENGPSFPLSTYEQTWLPGRAIRADVIARHMPPWGAVQGYGQFANDNSLTLREVQFLVSWVEGLGPRNSGTVFRNVAAVDGPRAAPVQAHADFDRWQLGEPNETRQVPAFEIEVPRSTGTARVTVDLGLAAERRLRAIEFRPADRRTIRAVDFSVQETGQWLGSWTPWFGYMSLPDGASFRLPVGSHLLAEIQYRGLGEGRVQGGSLGLFWADKAGPATASDIVLEGRGVGAGDGRRVRGEIRLTADVDVLALRVEPATDFPRSIEVTAKSADGRTDVLLFAKDLPREWPTPYVMKGPVRIRRGTDVSFTAALKGASSRAAVRIMVAGPRR